MINTLEAEALRACRFYQKQLNSQIVNARNPVGFEGREDTPLA
jgi:hypothetical protein